MDEHKPLRASRINGSYNLYTDDAHIYIFSPNSFPRYSKAYL